MSDAATVAGVAVPHPDDVFIAGAWVPGEGGRYTVLSPHDASPAIEVALPSVAQAAAAVEAADTVGRRWSVTPVAERVEICRRWCALMAERFDDFGGVWAVEAGMPLRHSTMLHKYAAVGAWNALFDVAEDTLRDEVRPSALGDVLVRREAAGVVVAIMSYNGPLVTIASKVLPALVAGCPVVVKGAIESQLILRLVAECAREAGFPEGALSILCGELDTARALTSDPRVDMVSLTGGHRAAQDVIEATRGRFARTHLELGGKSPALLLEDVDLGTALKSLVPAATSGSGQVCAALSRILVPRSRRDEIVDALAEQFDALTIGDPLDRATRIGPLTNPAALERTERFVARALAEGGRVVAGGGRPEGFGGGWYHQPTLVADVAPDSYLAQNEVFGPVTAVIEYDGVEDGIAIANGTDFGLSASVFSADRDRALECAGRIRAGSVGLNAFGPSLVAPFGGVKGSGWGREAGPEGIVEFTESKQVLIGPFQEEK